MRTDIVKLGLLTAISFSMACQASHEKAPFGATVTVPNDILISWSTADNTRNLQGLMVPFIIGVSKADDSTGKTIPLPYTEVTITTSFGGVYLLPKEAIIVSAYPDVPDEITSVEDVEDYCTDENGAFFLTEEWCAWYWDIETSQFYQFNGNYSSAFSETEDGSYYFAPTMMVTETNGMGIIEAYMFIDAMPVISEGNESAIQDVSITAGITWDSQPFFITTGSAE